MASKGKKPQGRGRSARIRATRRGWYIGAGALVLMVAAVVLMVANRPPVAEGFYRYSHPGEVSQLVGSGEPVLVYFHSPT